MITGKIKAICCLLSIVMCLFAFAGCGLSEKDRTALELLQAMKDQAAMQMQEAPEQYLIIVPAECTSELSLLARELSAAIEEKTGVECDYEYDSVAINTNKDRVDILLGNTNRRISSEALKDFKNDDYICKFIDDTIVIGGVSDAATVVAVERFMKEILPNATEYALMADDAGFEYYGKYMLSDVVLCGYDARDYVMVFSDADAQLMCLSLRSLIAKQSGIYLEVSAGEAAINGQKEIYLDIDSTAPAACAKRVGEDIYLLGKDTYSLSVAISSFYNMLLETESEGKVRLDISDQFVYSYSNAMMNVTSIVSDIPYKDSSLAEISALASNISECGSDIVVIAKMDRNVWETVKAGVSSKYGRIELEFSDGALLPVLYLKSNVSIEKSEISTVEGKEVLTLELVQNASAEKYTVYGYSSDSVSFKDVNETIKGNGDMAMAVVVMPESRDNSIVPDDSVSIVYNGVLSCADVDYRHLWMTAYPRLAHTDMQTTKVDNTDYIRFNVGNRYCTDYRELMS